MGRLGLRKGARDTESSWQKARLHFPLLRLPLGVGGWGGVVPLLLIGQFTLFYPLLPPFRGDGEAAACGCIKLSGILPGKG